MGWKPQVGWCTRTLTHTQCYIPVLVVNSHIADRHDPSSSWPSGYCSAVLVEGKKKKANTALVIMLRENKSIAPGSFGTAKQRTDNGVPKRKKRKEKKKLKAERKDIPIAEWAHPRGLVVD